LKIKEKELIEKDNKALGGLDNRYKWMRGIVVIEQRVDKYNK